jgi:elongator complex protein 1
MEYFISNNGGAWSLITQLDNPSYINLFLTDLREDDVVSTMYPNLSRPGSQTCTGTGWYGNGSKVNLVCKTMRDVLSSTDRNKYMLSIITTHIKMIPQELDEVLKLIKDIKDNPSAGVGPSVDEALKYSLLLIDVNQLYDSALGLYDFSLVLLVAEKSQKVSRHNLYFL